MAQFFQAQPDHAIEEGLQLLRQLVRAEIEAPVGHHHNHCKMLHPRMQLQEAEALGAKPVHEPGFGMHLHLQQHHRPLRHAGLPASGPERAIETMLGSFEFRCVKAIQHIPRGIRPEQGAVQATSAAPTAANSKAIRSGALWNSP